MDIVGIMGLLLKIILFLCAYSPLLSILLILWLPEISWCGILICLIPLLIAPLFGCFIFYKNKVESGQQSCIVHSITDKTHDVISYIVPYILSLISLQIQDIRGLIIIIILLILLYAVYANSPMIYINPLLSLLGYRIYQVELTDKEDSKPHEVMLISKGMLKKDQGIKVCDLSDEIYLQVNV